MTRALLTLLLTCACGSVEQPTQFSPCERHTRQLAGNVNGCWRVTARRGFEQDGQFFCEAEPSCAVFAGDAQLFVSGDVAWVGDVECSNECKETER